MIHLESSDLNSVTHFILLSSPVSYCRHSFPKGLNMSNRAHVPLYGASAGYNAYVV